MVVPKSKGTRIGWLVVNVMEQPLLHLFDAFWPIIAFFNAFWHSKTM